MECWPNLTGLNPGLLGGLNHLLAVGFQNACQRVYLILLLLCVFAYLTAELPLTVLYLSLPLRKLLQYLWLLCNSVCVWVRESERLFVCVLVDAGLWQILHPLDRNILFCVNSPLFPFLVALCSPYQGFITKQVSPIYTDDCDSLLSRVSPHLECVFLTKVCSSTHVLRSYFQVFNHTVAKRYCHVYKYMLFPF